MRRSAQKPKLEAWKRGAAAGLPLTRCLELMAGAGNSPADDATLARMRDAVAAGRPLEDQRGDLESLFGPARAALVVAGERAGTLEGSLTACLQLLEAERALGRRLVGALAYPVFLVGAALVLLPLPVVALEGPAAAFGRIYLPIGVVLICVATAGWKARGIWGAGGPGRLTLERALLRTPLVGPLFRAYGGALFFATLGASLEAGLDAARAVEGALAGSGVASLQAMAGRVAERVARGEPLSKVLAGTGVLEEQAIRELAIGEETGTLDGVARARATVEQEALADRGNRLALALGVAATGAVLLALGVAVVSFWADYFGKIGALAS